MAGSARRLQAQAGATTDIIVGTISSPDGAAVPSAQVEAMARGTGLARRAVTDAHGHFTIVFPDGGGAYRLSVRRLGFAPDVVAVQRRPGTDRLVADVVLQPTAVTLSAVLVHGGDSTGTRGASGTGRTLTPGELNRLPVDPGDLAALAALAPGVVVTAATDSTSTTFSVAGQPPSQNTITLDGLSQGTGLVPRDAIRSTRIVTSTFDVAMGHFLGGQIASTTRRGTNELTGSMTVTARDPRLTVTGPVSPAFAGGGRRDQLSAGVGGPIIRNRLFAFGAFQINRRTQPIASLLSADPATLGRLGVSADTLARFLGAVAGTGLPLTPAGFPTTRTLNDGSALLRVDARLNDANDLVLRADWHDRAQRGARVEWHGLTQSEGSGRGTGAGLMLALTSHVGSFVNEVRAYGAREAFDAQGYWTLPRGRVTTTGMLADGSVGVSSLFFGGNSSLPWWHHSSMFEGSDELSWLSPDASHRVKLGVLVDRNDGSANMTGNKGGLFLYHSLADLEAGVPAQYTRVLFSRPEATRALSGAVYLGDAWRVTPSFELTYGARAEWARYGLRPASNPLVDSLFARRTSDLPSDFLVSPRIGFTYAPGDDQGGTGFSVRGGVGEFRGNVRPRLFSLAAGGTGLPGSVLQLTCVGASVPTPDWSAYLQDPASVPSTCAGGATGLSAALPRVTVFAPDYTAPRAWRASLGATEPLGHGLSVAVDALYARGTAGQGVMDLNLDTRPRFRLAAEGGRPVYVPASSIDPRTGAMSSNASRLWPTLGPVMQITSGLHSETRQLVITANRESAGGLNVSASYTYTRSRDQSQGFEGAEYDESTAGNPNGTTWGWNDDARRHQLQATVAYTFDPTLQLTLVGRTLSGRPYTPLVGGDINGDGFQNDRAFVFGPAAADTAVARGMRQLLATADARTRDCLVQQMRSIAGRNSCTTPWWTSVDLQMNVTPNAFGLRRRLTLSLTAVNAMAGLDDLLHGMNHLRGWGQYVRRDDRLLFVDGFDPATGTFRYRVNQHFGASGLTTSPFRTPFLLQLQARIAFGALRNG